MVVKKSFVAPFPASAGTPHHPALLEVIPFVPPLSRFDPSDIINFVNTYARLYLCKMKSVLKRNPVLAILLYLLPGFVAALAFTALYNRLNSEQIQQFILSFGYGAGVVFILLFTVRTLFVFAPYYVLLVVGGTLFGKQYGLIYNFIAVFLSATLSYVISKSLRSMVFKRFGPEKYAMYVALIQKHGFKIMVFMRVAIIFPFDLLNYAAGLAGMRYKQFIAANLIGVIPEVIFLTCYGQSLKTPRSLQFLILSIFLLLIMILMLKFKKNIITWIQSFL